MFSLNNIPIAPSRTLFVISSGVHVLAVALCLAYELPLLFQLLMAITILLAYIYFYRRHISLLSPFSIHKLSWLAEEKSFSLKQRNGQWLTVTAIQTKLMTPFAVFMNVQVEQRLFPVPLIIWKDSIGADNFRRLRVLMGYAHIDALSAN